MDMRELAEMLAPNTMSQVDQVAGRPSVGGVMGFPMSAVQDVSRPALSLVDSGIGALSQGLRRNPNIGKFLNAANAGFAAAGGDFNQRERSRALNAQAGMFDARAAGYQSDSRLSDAQAGLINGFGGPSQPGGGQFEITDDLLARMTLSGQQEQANSLRALRDNIRERDQDSAKRDAYGRMWDGAQLDSRRKETKKEWDQYQDIGDKKRKVATTPVSGLGIPILVNILQQEIDPGAVVRDSDVRIITKGALSGSDLTVNDLLKWIDSDAGSDVLVPKLRDTIINLLDAKEDEFANKFENAQLAAPRLGMTQTGAERAIPFWDKGIEAVANRDARRSGSKSATPVVDSPFMQIPSETLQPIIDQVESEMPGLSDQQLIREVNRIVKANREANISQSLGIRGN